MLKSSVPSAEAIYYVLHMLFIHMGIGARQSPPPPWIFKHGTDKVEGSLMVLFFGLVLSVSPLEIFLLTPLFVNHR